MAAVTADTADTPASEDTGGMVAILLLGADMVAMSMAAALATADMVADITPIAAVDITLGDITHIGATMAASITPTVGIAAITIITGATPITVGIAITAIMVMAGHTCLTAITEEGAAGYIVAL